MTSNQPFDNLVQQLQERAKELNCLYTVEESLSRSDINTDEALNLVVKALPAGWQYSNVCEAKLIYEDQIYKTSDFKETPWLQSAYIVVQEKVVGSISIYYTQEMPNADEGPFLHEEKKLVKTIADRIGHYLLHQRLKSVFEELNTVRNKAGTESKGEWRIVLNMIRKTDPNLFMSILRKLLHQLIWNGVQEADLLLKQSSISKRTGEYEQLGAENKPLEKKIIKNYDQYIEVILTLADQYLTDEVILSRIQKWIQEDKSSELVKVVENQDTTLSDIGDAIRKYYHLAPEKFELSPSTIKGLRVSLLRRFFTDDLEFISIAKEYVKLTDFYKLIDKMIFPPSSHGKLGGKSAGLFLSSNILLKYSEENELLINIKVPNTWYITSDGILYFMQYNNLEEALEQKYKEIDEVRLEYPQIVQVFKNSQFPPDIIKGLSVALDDLSDKPLVVRSSSLLEDQVGAAFSGKYKSLFLANQGTKKERLAALMDAIAEVYSSTFGPDPIEYRADRGLLDFHEEMGIMIQEVVGNRIGDYFLPTFAGVAFSNNEFRWSPRIRREDGLVRMVPGLGTRAVDRVSNDFPILLTPGQPNLRVNVTVDETIKYSPKMIDVINLKTNQFETIGIDELYKKCGESIPGIENIVSSIHGDHLRDPVGIDIDFSKEEYVVTCNGLINKTKFIKQIDTILKVLQEKLKTPVDIEFASDGKDFYLLQCRSQGYSRQNIPDPIPKEIPLDKILFSAKKYVSNGKVPELTHLVYVDPQHYGELEDRQKLLQVGTAIGRINTILPKRQFVLMGPGRWGSRGDIKLGVSVTYSDINNTALLVEIARKKDNYIPDLSFGTHFFQDLVEASIRYLPLYPDDPGIIFNQRFFQVAKNILGELLPDYSHLEQTIKVIDLPNSTDGLILKVLINAELDEAVGMLAKPITNDEVELEQVEFTDWQPSDQWRWRFRMAEKIASEIKADKFGVKGFYIFGSTKNAMAGPASDIDLLIHIEKNNEKQEKLKLWFDGWSLCLSEMNYLRTGYKTEGLLDVHYITDEDIENKTSYALKLGAVTDAAKKIEMNLKPKR